MWVSWASNDSLKAIIGRAFTDARNKHGHVVQTVLVKASTTSPVRERPTSY